MPLSRTKSETLTANGAKLTPTGTLTAGAGAGVSATLIFPKPATLLVIQNRSSGGTLYVALDKDTMDVADLNNADFVVAENQTMLLPILTLKLAVALAGVAAVWTGLTKNIWIVGYGGNE